MLDNGGRVPFYEYRRPDGTTIEVMQKMTDPPLTEDPDTGVPLERVFHPSAKGFYNTDYGTKKRAREKAESDSSKAGDSSKTDSAATDSKAAPKTESAKTETKQSSSPKSD
jgi:predicted nucleic acid-binding Zn ribbon protein